MNTDRLAQSMPPTYGGLRCTQSTPNMEFVPQYPTLDDALGIEVFADPLFRTKKSIQSIHDPISLIPLANAYMGAKQACEKEKRVQLIALAAIAAAAILFCFTPMVPLVFVALEAAVGIAAIVKLAVSTHWKWKVEKWENAFALLFAGKFEQAREAILALRNHPSNYHSFHYWNPREPEMQNQSKKTQVIGQALLLTLFCLKQSGKSFERNHVQLAKEDLKDQSGGKPTISQQNAANYLEDVDPTKEIGARNGEMIPCQVKKISLGRMMIVSTLFSAMHAPENLNNANAIFTGWKSTLEKARALLIEQGEYNECQARIADELLGAISYADFYRKARMFDEDNLILLLKSSAAYEGYDDQLETFITDTAFNPTAHDREEKNELIEEDDE